MAAIPLLEQTSVGHLEPVSGLAGLARSAADHTDDAGRQSRADCTGDRVPCL